MKIDLYNLLDNMMPSHSSTNMYFMDNLNISKNSRTLEGEVLQFLWGERGKHRSHKNLCIQKGRNLSWEKCSYTSM